jgi:transposase
VPYWPKDRFLELAPKYWTATRARIPTVEIRREVGDITVPPPLPAAEQTVSR